MARPQIIANGGSPGVKASVSAASAITLTLDSIVGVRSVQWSVLSTDDSSSIGDYTLMQSGSVGQTATTTSLTAGTAVLFKVVVNSGLVRGLPNLDETSNTVKCFVPTAEGLEVGAAGETYESDSTYGTTEILNAPIRVLNGFTTSLYANDLKRAEASETSNVALTGNPSPMDGATIATGDIVLLLGQTAPAENGLWTVNTSGAWARPDNFSTTEAVQGSTIAVVKGTLRKGFFYQNTNVNDPVVGVGALTFSRIPDRFDRVDLAAASATPGNAILTRYGSASELNAAYLTSNGTNPAASGFVRAVKNAVGLAFRNDGNTGDIEAVTMEATNILRIGSNSVAQLIAKIKNAGAVSILNDTATMVELALSTGMKFGRTMLMSLFQEAASGSAGTDATIEAQTGDTGFDGGALYLRSGTKGTGGSPGKLILDSKDDGTVSGDISLRAGSFGEFLGITYNDSTSRVEHSYNATKVRFSCTELELDATNVALCASTGSFAGGSQMVFIANTTATPAGTPTGGGVLYVEAGALKWKGPGGTTTTIAVS